MRALHAVAFTCLMGLACGGSPGSPTAPLNPGTVILPGNRPPVIAGATASPTFGIADIQSFRFEVNATDPDGDRLSYHWDLGLGVMVDAGQFANATYEGGQSTEWTVTVRVSDPSGLSATTSIKAMVGSVNGLWQITSGEFTGGQFALLQDSAGKVTGNYVLPGAGSQETITNGQITPAAQVTLPLRLGSRTMTFTGTMDTTGRRINGTIDGAGCVLTSQ